jgi:hypothetical protein
MAAMNGNRWSIQRIIRLPAPGRSSAMVLS